MESDNQFLVEALYDFEPKADSDGETELEFKKGDVITVFDNSDDNWWGGSIGDRTGYFPRTYVQAYKPNNIHSWLNTQYKALHWLCLLKNHQIDHLIKLVNRYRIQICKLIIVLKHATLFFRAKVLSSDSLGEQCLEDPSVVVL